MKSVKDVSEERPSPGTGILKEIPDLTGNVAEYENFLEAIHRTADVPVGFEPIKGESHGYFSPSEQRIAIREGMSEAQTLKTAIHELAHSRLHNMDQNSRDPKVKGKDRNTKEVEAESIAFVVCSHCRCFFFHNFHL